MAPRISVIIPIYNGAKSLMKSVQTVWDQGYPNFELILVNDGSSDDSAQIIDSIEGAVAIHQENKGVAAARNAGIKAATGEFIALLDQDDLWHANKTRDQLAFLQANPDVEYVMGHWVHELVGDGPAPSWVKPKVFEGPLPAWVFSSFLARTSVFEKAGLLDEALKFGGDDVDWFSRTEYLGIKRVMEKKVVMTHVIHSENLSAKTEPGNKELLSIMRGVVARRREKQND